MMPTLTIGRHTTKIPIVQGGMSVGISLSGLASAVASEGGIGVIGTAGIGSLEPDVDDNYREANIRALKREILKARKWTDGVIGCNVMMALSNYDDMIATALKENIDLIFVGAGLLLRLPDIVKIEDIKKGPTSLVPIVSSAHGASILFRYWSKNYDYVPDAVVVEGPMAGGHLGFTKEQINDPDYALEKLVPPILQEIRPHITLFEKPIPVIAGGGIYYGSDIYRMIKMGATGVQMATRFVGTYECDASPGFKEAYMKCGASDIEIIQSPVGMPGRAIHNEFLEGVSKGMKKPVKCGWRCIRTCDPATTPYCIALALTNARDGKLKDGYAFCGANAYRVQEITTVERLIFDLKQEYEDEEKNG